MGKIVIGSELSDSSKQALATGIYWAEKLSLEPLILHGDPIADYEALNTIFGVRNIELQKKEISEILKANALVLDKQVRKIPSNIKNIKSESRPGKPEDVLIYAAREKDVRLIVLGYRPEKQSMTSFIGRISEAVIHRSEKSILIVKTDAKKLKKIVVGYDFSFHSDQALLWAERLALSFKAEIHIVNVIPATKRAAIGEITKKLSDLAQGLIEKGIVVIPAVWEKNKSVSKTLISYQEQEAIDLVILGSHSRGKIEELFLGSVASKMTRESPRNILVVK